jgi:hypothetical protein
MKMTRDFKYRLPVFEEGRYRSESLEVSFPELYRSEVRAGEVPNQVRDELRGPACGYFTG